MNTMRYQDYTAQLEYSDEDGCFIGRVAGIRDILTFHGDSVDELRSAFEEAIDFYLETCTQRGETPAKPYSGTLELHVPPDVHARAAWFAEANGKNLNQWISDVLKNATTSTAV